MSQITTILLDGQTYTAGSISTASPIVIEAAGIGPRGVQGTAGSNGAQGTVGAQGANGTQGANGAQGTQGTIGPQGIQGIRGDRYAATSSTVFTHSDYYVGGPVLTVVLNNPPFSYTPGQNVLINYVDDINIWLRGVVWGYNVFSSQLSIQITDTSAPYGNALGSWNVNLEGQRGAQGIQGAAGTGGGDGEPAISPFLFIGI